MSQPFGRYLLHDVVAKGGMAEIFLAEQPGPGGVSREIVIKRILPEFAAMPRFVEMFLDEARVVAQLSHPNIVPVIDFGEVEGSYFIAMERVLGPSLREIGRTAARLARTLPFAVLAKIIAQIAEGLAYAHQLRGPSGTPLQVVHRDISPSNVLVSYDGVPKLLDFGIAKASSSTHKTRTGVIKGKLSYMSPEQVLGEELDQRADIYSLGVVLYQLAANRRPFAEKSEYSQMTSILEGQAEPPRELNPAIPESLQLIILKAMAPLCDQRHADARELARDLEQFVLQQGGPLSSFDIADELQRLEEESGEHMAPSGLTRHTQSSAAEAEAPALPGEATVDSRSASHGDRAAGSTRPAAEPVASAPEPRTEPMGSAPAPVAVVRSVRPDMVLAEPAEAAAPLNSALRSSRVPLLVTALIAASLGGLAVTALPGMLGTGASDTAAPLPVRAVEVTPDAARAAVPDGALAIVAVDAGQTRSERRPRRPGRRPRTPAPAHTPAALVPDATPTAVAEGSVLVHTTPWTAIYLDGRHLGDSPTRLSLPAGSYRLTLRNPEQGIEQQLRIELKAGEELKLRRDFTPGEVVVLVHPWGKVFVDGKLRGTTPLSPLKLSPGPHRIEVVSRDGSQREARQIEVQAGKRQQLSIKLHTP